MVQTDIKNCLETALCERVKTLNSDIYDDELILSIAKEIANNRVRSIKEIQEDKVYGKIGGKPRKQLIKEITISGIWGYSESLTGEWALFKYDSLNEALNDYSNRPNTVLLKDGLPIEL